MIDNKYGIGMGDWCSNVVKGMGLVCENKVQMVGLDLSHIHILGMGWL